MQLALAFLGTTAAQKGPLWWAAHHRAHHRYSDTERDIHSPQKGFWWSHVGWILCDRYGGTDLDAIPDLANDRALRFIDRFNWVGPWTLGVFSFLVAGWSGLIIGFFGSTIVLWHAMFTVNSLNHTFGTRRFATADTSRNNVLLALLTFGEGWHNNHHHYQASARQGFYWWEFDISWLGLRAMKAARLVSGLRQPTAVALRSNRVRDGMFDLGMFRAAWRRAGGCRYSVPSQARRTGLVPRRLVQRQARFGRDRDSRKAGRARTGCRSSDRRRRGAHQDDPPGGERNHRRLSVPGRGASTTNSRVGPVPAPTFG